MRNTSKETATVEETPMVGRPASRGGVRKRSIAEAIWLGTFGVCGLAVALAVADIQIPTTLLDFKMGGSQPLTLTRPLFSATNCSNCHAYYDAEREPFTAWAASLMGQSARDPVFHAALAVANQDAANAGEFCLRCHVPMGWMNGRSSDPTGGSLIETDFEGVSCSICHRMVDPVYEAGVSPSVDLGILDALTIPTGPHPHNGNFVIDPLDRRRGPFVLNFAPHQWLHSPFHRESQMCATCHEVANPVYSKTPQGDYSLNALNQPHPTNNTFDMPGEQRTYTEWLLSSFAEGPIDMGGRFGGNNPLVSSCQDCHMPKTTGQGCDPNFEPPVRSDLPQHHFLGANTWVLRAVQSLYPDSETNLTEDSVNASLARTTQNLKNASDLELAYAGGTLTARIINQTGHKLPTGYPEGRRVWVNVRFFNTNGDLVSESGAYNDTTAELNTVGTKVYEAKMGIDAAVAAYTGKPVGESFHLAINHMFYKDNRIPPRGFTNAAYESADIDHVGYSYEDGQYWDDTQYPTPEEAVRAEVRVLYQTTSKEYIEFLRDENTTNNAGQIAYDQWVLHGKSAPAEIDFDSIDLVEPCVGDFDQDGGITGSDIAAFFTAFEQGDSTADVDQDGGITGGDIAIFFIRFEAGC